MSSRREEVAQRKPFKRVFSGLFRKQKGCGPFEIPGVPDLQCPPSRASSTYFGSTLFLACKYLLTCKKSDDFTAEQQIWKTCPPQGIFALQKSLRGGLQWGTGDLIAENAAPRKEIFRENLLCAESGLTNLSYPRLQSVQKYVGTPNRYNRLYRAAPGCQRGRCPSVSEGVQRKPFRRVFFGQLLPGGSTRRFFAQLRSVGSNHQAGRLLPVELWRLRHGKK